MAGNWHHWDLEKVFKTVQSYPSGITYALARKRLRKGKINPLVILLGFISVLIILLSIPPARSILVSRLSLLVLFTLLCQGIIYRSFVIAKKKWHIAESASQKAIVKRDHRYIVIPVRSLVEGDIVRIEPGDWIGADIRLVVLQDLVIARTEGYKWQIQNKDTTAPLPLDVPPPERSNMILPDSLVVKGQAMGVVVRTYKNKPLGQIKPKLPGLFTLILIWLGLGGIFLFISFSSLSLTIVYLLFILSVPFHWLNILEVCLYQGMNNLKEQGIILKSSLFLWNLSKIDKILIDLDSYPLSHPSLSGVSLVGLKHKDEIDNESIPVLKFMDGLALPPAHCLALLTNSLVDETLFTKVDLTISSTGADEVLQRQSSVVLARNDCRLVERGIKEGRYRIDRVRRVVHFNFCSGVSLLLFLGAGLIIKEPTITPLQILWSGVFLPTGLSLLFLIEPEPEIDLPPNRYFFDQSWIRRLLLNVLMMSLPTLLVFRFTTVSFAWTVFNFSLLSLGSSLVRVPLLKFYQWLGASLGVVILQVIWVQTTRSAMTPISIWHWLMAILIASGIFWLNELLDFRLAHPKNEE